MNNRTDSVLGESSLSFWINLESTQFRGQFCEPVTRKFVFGGGPNSNRAHQWVVAFIENMINGVVTVDIDVWRIEEEDPQPPQQELSKLQQRQQHQLWGEEEQQQHKRSSQAEYKTIAIHTPMMLLPVSVMSIANGATEESPIHVGLDANSIGYRDRFIFEIVLSEEHSSYQIPNPLASNRILDSLMYNVVATTTPSQESADIWFEFPISEEVTSNILSAHGLCTPILGAHSRILSKHKYFRDWIDRERQNQEAQRRRQLDEERRIHQQQQAMKIGTEQIQLWPIYPEQQLQMTITETSPRVQSVLPQTDTEQQYLLQQSLPALRIPVTDISFGTFQVLLQFLYTGQICLTDEQVQKVEDYWNMNPRDRYRLEGGNDMPEECGTSEGAFPKSVPIQLPNPIKEPKDHWQPQVSIADALNPWLNPDEAKSRIKVENGVEGESKGGDDRDADNSDNRIVRQYRARQSCSWEMLLTISKRLGLNSLEEVAKKALQYRLQMKVLQTTISPRVMNKIAHNGFDDTKLDLQLAQGEQILWSFLQLYHSSFRIQREADMESSERYQEQERDQPWGTRAFRRQGRGEEQFFHLNAWDGTWTGTIGSGEGGDESSGATKVHPEISRSLFDNPECEKAIAELCKELRSTFLRMRDIKCSDGGY